MCSPSQGPVSEEIYNWTSARSLIWKLRLLLPWLLIWAAMLWPVSKGIQRLFGWDPIASSVASFPASYLLLTLGVGLPAGIVVYLATAIHGIWRSRRRLLKRRAARERKRLRLLRESSPSVPPA